MEKHVNYGKITTQTYQLNSSFLNFSLLQKKNKSISVGKAKDQAQISQLFHLPLSDLAHSQMVNLTSTLDSMQLTDDYDSWGYVWGSNIFAATKAYKKLIGHHPVHPVFSCLWKTFCQPKFKVLFWLLLKDRLSTRNIIRRKNMHLESYNCVLCNLATEETVTHLFLECPLQWLAGTLSIFRSQIRLFFHK